MNEAINVNYIDETEYPRVAVMCGRCINIIANMWNSPEKAEWKTGALGIGSSEACMLGGVAAWLRWRAKRKAEGKPFDKPNLVMSSAFQVVWEKFCQLWQIETAHRAPHAGSQPTLDPKHALADVRREHHLHRAHRRRDVDGTQRRHRGARHARSTPTTPRRDTKFRSTSTPRRAVSSCRSSNPEVKWDFRLKWVLVDLHVGPQVRTGLSGPGLGRLEGQEVSARRDVVLASTTSAPTSRR